MTIYLWHRPLTIALSGVALLIPGASPEPGSAARCISRPIFFVVGLAALLTFLPAHAVTEWFLDFPLAVLGEVFVSVAIVLLGRWRSRAP